MNGSVPTGARRGLIASLGLLLVACAGSQATAPSGTPSLTATTSPVKLKAPEGIAIGADGTVYVSDYEGGYVFRLGPDGSLLTIAGTLAGPAGLAVDRSGNLYVAEEQGHRVRRVDSGGTLTTIAGNGEASFSGDGGPATSASLRNPLGLAFDGTGALYIGDEDNATVRRVDLKGMISSLNSSMLPAAWRPGYLAVDAAGALYVSGRTRGVRGGCRIFRVAPAGPISVVAGTGECGFIGDGGPAIAAELNDPNGLAFDSAGNLYFSDSKNQRIRRIDRNGVITTVAGNGVAGSSGDGGLGTQAQLNNPFGIGIGPGDKLYIAEGGGHRVRLLDLSTGIINRSAG
jgi:sugar lactone lactonase YvrE